MVVMNGKLFKLFLNKYPFLTVVNATNLCKQVITRSRISNGNLEEAALDFFIVCFKILPYILKMTINDHKRLTRFCKDKVVESDHSPVQLHLNIKPPQQSSTRMEIINLKDPESIAIFKKETSKYSTLSDSFKGSLSFPDQIARWKKKFDSSICKSFKKIRLGGKKKEKENEVRKLMGKRMDMKGALKN